MKTNTMKSGIEFTDSDQQLKEILLMQARLMYPVALKDASDIECLGALLKKSKKALALLNTLLDYSWSEAQPEMYKACTYYLIESQQVSKKERVTLNRQLYDRMRLDMKMAENRELMLQISLYYQNLCTKITEVLEKYPQQESTDQEV